MTGPAFTAPGPYRSVHQDQNGSLRTPGMPPLTIPPEL